MSYGLVIWYDMDWCDMDWCDVIWIGVIWISVIWIGVIWINVIWIFISRGAEGPGREILQRPPSVCLSVRHV